jgi:hypothetical protein
MAKVVAHVGRWLGSRSRGVSSSTSSSATSALTNYSIRSFQGPKKVPISNVMLSKHRMDFVRFVSSTKRSATSSVTKDKKLNSKPLPHEEEGPESPSETTADPVSPSSQSKKRAKRKTTGGRFIGDEQGRMFDTKNTFPVMAYATCEELDLEKLHDGLIAHDLYIPTVLNEGGKINIYVYIITTPNSR